MASGDAGGASAAVGAASFAAMGLTDELLRGIAASGFDSPSPIQQRAIAALIRGEDMIAASQSGSGKTAAFAIPILQRLDAADSDCQALILAPTRELVQQTARTVTALSSFMTIRVHALGANVSEDAALARGGAQVVVGTPGSVAGMISRGALHVHKLKLCVVLTRPTSCCSMSAALRSRSMRS